MILIKTPHRIAGSVFFRCDNLEIGENATIHDRVTFVGKRITIGKNVWIGQDCFLDGTNNLTIGDNVAIGLGTCIFTHSGTYGKEEWGGSVYIKNNAHVFPKAYIYPNLTIGESAKVAPCSVVTKNVEARRVVGGIPAKVIGEVK